MLVHVTSGEVDVEKLDLYLVERVCMGIYTYLVHSFIRALILP